MEFLRFLFAIVAGLRAVFVYGEVASMISEPWALQKAERVLAALAWRPRPSASRRPVGEPAGGL